MPNLDDAFFVLEMSRRNAEVKAVPLSGLTPDMWGSQSQLGNLSPYAVYETVAYIYRCIQYRSSAIAGIPWTLEGTSRRANIPMLKARLPDLLRRIEGSLCIDAGAYIFPERNKTRLLDLKWLRFDTVEPQFNISGLSGFKRRVGTATPIDLKPEELIYIWLPDPLTEVGPGRAPLHVALKSAGIIAAANEFTVQFFARGGMNITLMLVDASTGDPDLKKLEAWWKRLVAGVRSAWQTVAIRKNVDIKQFGYEPEKLAMPALKAEARAEIVAAFGLSEDIIASNAANHATATTHALTTWQSTILPEAKVISAALNNQLFNPMGLEFVWHPEQMEILQQVNALQADAIVKLYTAGIITVEQAQKAAGFPTPDKAVVADSENQETAPTDEGPPEPTPPTGGQPKALRRAIKSAEDGMDAERASLEDAHVSDIAQALEQQLAAVLSGTVTDPKAAAARVSDEDPMLRAALMKLLIEAVNLGVGSGQSSLADATIGVDWSLINENARKWAEEYSYELVKGINDTSRDLLRDKVTQWIESGEALDALRDSLAPWFGAMRAEVIASTEVTRAFAQGNLQAWQGSRVVNGIIFRTANDELVCDQCSPFGGKVFALGDAEHTPPIHPRCRCWISPSVDRGSGI